MNDEYITIFAVLPKEIYQTKKLSPEDKLIAERLVYLCKKEGYSWITNKTLADMYGIKEDSVSQHITNLRNYGFIKCIYENKTHGKSNRTIYLTEELWNKQPNNIRFDNQSNIGLRTGHNNNYNNLNNNKVISPVPDWLGKEIPKVEATSEEIAELEEILSEFRGEKHE